MRKTRFPRVFLYGLLIFGALQVARGDQAKPAPSRKGPAEIIWRVQTTQKVVALTLDDGPDPKYTPTVLKIAKDKGVKLTFFLIGKMIQAHPELARQEVADGHVLGNHTWDHPVMKGSGETQDIDEIERCEAEIEKIAHERTHLFRPPKGMWDGEVFLAAEAHGYSMILWTVTVEHQSAKTPEAMARRVIDMIQPGMIILAHDGEPGHALDRRNTMKALPIIIDALHKKGYRFVTIPELLKIGREKMEARK